MNQVWLEIRAGSLAVTGTKIDDLLAAGIVIPWIARRSIAGEC
jgi:hypothetical protein